MSTAKKRTGYRFAAEIDELIDRAASQGMDSQEQDTLIAHLSAQDASTTAVYRRVFMGIPLACLLYLLLALCLVPYPAGADISASPAFYILAMLSLVVSFATAWGIPAAGSDGPGSTAAETADDKADRVSLEPVLRLMRAVPQLARYEGQIRQVLSYLVVLNAGLCVLICLVVGTVQPAQSRSSVSLTVAAVPVLLVSIAVAIAKHELRPVDIQSLERLKYDYKGA